MESPLEGYPRHPPPHRAEKSHILHVGSRQVRSADAISTRGIYSQRRGEGGKNVKRCHSLTDHQINCKLKTKIANTILLLCYLDKMCLQYLLLVAFGKLRHIYIVRESIKGSRSRQPALSRLHYVLQSTPLWKKEVGHSNTRGTVSLGSFPAEILLHIVYISNILCGLEVIDSRRLQ